MTGPDLAHLGLSGAADAIADGSLSPVELVEAALETIERREPDVSAFVVVGHDTARADAARLADELVRGAPRSPLHGVPIAVKDLIDVAGLPTRAGSEVLADVRPAERDATVVAHLRAAGAVVVGKTHTHEFALGSVTPQTRHPTHPDRIVGGSSGGSAAAIAAGEALVALGTDTGGSIRTPAALCGVAGLNPRWGQVPVTGIVPLSPLLDVCGPLARTVDDLIIAWSVLAGAGSALGRSTTQSYRARFVTASRESLGTVRDEVWSVFDSVVAALTRTPDMHVARGDFPAFDDWNPARSIVLQADVLAVHRARGWYPSRADRYGPTLRAALDRASGFDSSDVVSALHTLRPLMTRLGELLDGADALVLPTTSEVAPLRADIERDAAGGGPGDGRVLLRLCAPFNWLPVAAVSVPAGTDAAGLPIGIQVVARDEATALRAAGSVATAAKLVTESNSHGE